MSRRYTLWSMWRPNNVQFCLDRIGASAPGWSTLVVAGTVTTRATPEQVWAVWSDLGGWPRWSPLHKATAWVSRPGFVRSAQFNQTLALGFPAGTTTRLVTLDDVETLRQVSWSSAAGDLTSCHSWSFTPQADGGTRISNVLALTGRAIGLLRPLVANRWNRQFQRAVERLAQAAAEA
ncbi:SRPBCC family protein [Asanoa sp. NPDC049573]|uniref:SRPBCC family protein n=1 Tax=Asanoa sp. NPDC049573 TaxID=3155396 RepID=UPI003415ADA2